VRSANGTNGEPIERYSWGRKENIAKTIFEFFSWQKVSKREMS
jgi:hypothetical protein